MSFRLRSTTVLRLVFEVSDCAVAERSRSHNNSFRLRSTTAFRLIFEVFDTRWLSEVEATITSFRLRSTTAPKPQNPKTPKHLLKIHKHIIIIFPFPFFARFQFNLPFGYECWIYAQSCLFLRSFPIN
jgi:hypothetical protein